MKVPTLAGIALLILGVVLLLGGNFTSSRDVIDVGGLTVTAEERHPVRPWIAGLVLLSGVVLVVTDARRKS